MSLTLDPKKVIEVTLSDSTMRETFLLVAENGYWSDARKAKFYHAKDFPDSTLEEVFRELEETYKDTQIKFTETYMD